MLIEIQETHPTVPGKKMATVAATGGQRYGVWPAQLANLRLGGKFEGEVESWQSNGCTLQKIMKATPINGAAFTANGNGVVHPAPNGSAPAAAPVSAEEAAFVREVLCAMIMKGEVPYTKKALNKATHTLRGLYGAIWRGETTGGGYDSN